MIYARFMIPLLLWIAWSPAHAIGLQRIEVPAHDGLSRPLEGAVWYPCTGQVAQEMQLGPFVLSVARDCPVTGEKLPLVVISHGKGGTFLGHHDTAEALADAGFVVVAINHPGDTAADKSRIDDVSVFVDRPDDIKRTIDFMLESWTDAARLDADHIGIFGFSRGAYTGLVAIGATPRFRKRLRLCRGVDSVVCDQIRNEALPELTHDPRIKAAVIADPLSVFFTDDSFRHVTVPVQLWGSEHGGHGAAPESTAEIGGLLPVSADLHTVPMSRHYDFLAPCPTALARLARDLCASEPGFDRVAFHRAFNGEVVSFFSRHLMDARTP